jgi:hypothetical protein
LPNNYIRGGPFQRLQRKPFKRLDVTKAASKQLAEATVNENMLRFGFFNYAMLRTILSPARFFPTRSMADPSAHEIAFVPDLIYLVWTIQVWSGARL